MDRDVKRIIKQALGKVSQGETHMAIILCRINGYDCAMEFLAGAIARWEKRDRYEQPTLFGE